MTAKEILLLLKKKPRLSPVMISDELKLNRQMVRNVLSVLSELRLVDTPVRGLYEITSSGKQVLRKM